MLRLAYKNFTESTLRTFAIIITIAITSIILFLCFSYRQIVATQFSLAQKVEAENADIRIEYKPEASSRIINDTALTKLNDKADFFIGVLDLYGVSQLNDKTEYINLRGIDEENLYRLNTLEVTKGVDRDIKSDEIIIDKYTSKSLQLDIDSSLKLTIGNLTKTFYVAKIVKEHPCFKTDGAYVFYCKENVASQFIGGYFGNIYNKIFIKAAKQVDIDTLIDEIKAIPDYTNYKVVKEFDQGIMTSKINNAALPMTLALFACAFLSLYLVYLIANASYKRKNMFIFQLKSIGASKKYIFGIFTLESFMYMFFGVIIGFLCNTLLKNYSFFNLIPLDKEDLFYTKMLILSALVSATLFLICMLIPLLKTNSISARTQYTDAKNTLRKDKKLVLILGIVMFSTSCFLILPTYLNPIRGFFALILCFFSLLIILPHLTRFLTNLTKNKINKSGILLALNNIGYEKMSANNLRILFAGIVICTMLVSSSMLTNNLSKNITSDINCDVVLLNVRSDSDLQLNSITALDSLYNVHAINMKKAHLTLDNKSVDFTLLSCYPSDLDTIGSIEYVTPKETLLTGIEKGIALNYSYHKIHKLNIGDTISIDIDGKSAFVEITSFFNSYQFGGKIAIMSNELLSNTFSLPLYDTVICQTNTDIESTINMLRARYTNSNIIVLSKDSLYSVYTEILADTARLANFFAAIIIVICFVSVFSNILNTRNEKKNDIYKLYSLGFDKKGIMLIELIEYMLTGIIAIILSIIALPILNSALINAFSLGEIYIKSPISYAYTAIIGAGFIFALFITALTSYFIIDTKKVVAHLKLD